MPLTFYLIFKKLIIDFLNKVYDFDTMLYECERELQLHSSNSVKCLRRENVYVS